MKHLFLVHSYATYQCSLGVMREESLEAVDCLFVESRGFQCCSLPKGSRRMEISSLYCADIPSIRRPLRAWRSLRRLDKQVFGLFEGAAFLLYTPHSWWELPHLLSTHRSCHGVCYIEEGVTSYWKPGEIDRAYPPRARSKVHSAVQFFVLAGRLPGRMNFYDSGYRRVYGLTEESFPGWPRKTTVGLPMDFEQAAMERPAGLPFLVFDALVEAGLTSSGLLVLALLHFFDSLAERGVEAIRYKFHPNQTEQGSRQAIRGLFARFSRWIRFEEIPSGNYLENHFLEDGAEVYVFNSAAGLYASYAHCKVITLNPLIVQNDPSYQDRVDLLPEAYRVRVMPFQGAT